MYLIGERGLELLKFIFLLFASLCNISNGPGHARSLPLLNKQLNGFISIGFFDEKKSITLIYLFEYSCKRDWSMNDSTSPKQPPTSSSSNTQPDQSW